MRLMLLAAMFCLGVCWSYASCMMPVPPESQSYDGPATFLSLANTGGEDGGDMHWILVCRVEGQRVAFDAKQAWVRRAVAGMRAGERVRLAYELPAVISERGSELGPPTLRGIGGERGFELGEVRQVVALGTPAGR